MMDEPLLTNVSFLYDKGWKCTSSPLFAYDRQTQMTFYQFVLLFYWRFMGAAILTFASIWFVDKFIMRLASDNSR